MKSSFFTDTQELDALPPPCDKICVCLLMNHQAYELAAKNASRLHITTGEYMDRLIFSQPLSVCDTKAPLPPDNPWQRLPPAPPDH